jgi:salicylate hydroxylase
LQDILQDAENWLPWQGLFVPPLPNWRHEGLLLLGDAAHGTLPFLAQGAAMALEDAAHLHGRKWDADQLANFMAIRQRRTGRLHRATLQAGRRYHARGFERLIRNAALTMISDSAFWQRLDWLYKA